MKKILTSSLVTLILFSVASLFPQKSLGHGFCNTPPGTRSVCDETRPDDCVNHGECEAVGLNHYCCLPIVPTPTVTPGECIGEDSNEPGICVLFQNQCRFENWQIDGKGIEPDKCSVLFDCCVYDPYVTEPFKPTDCTFCPPGDPPEVCARYPEIQTALGCLPTHPLTFINRFQFILLRIGIGITFIMMVVGAFFVMTGQGNPEQVKRGRQVFLSGVAGLLIMIFGVFILEIIVVDILGLL